MSVTVQGDADGNVTLNAATVSNVEVVSVRNVTSDSAAGTDGNTTAPVLTVDGANFLGETEFVSDRSTAGVTFTNIEKADVTVVGNTQSALGAVTIDVGATSVTDAFVLNIKDGANSATLAGANPGGNLAAINVVDTDADWTEATINSTGAANFVGNVNLSGNGSGNPGTHTVKTLTINAATNLTTGAVTGFSTTAADNIAVNISGAASSVNLGALAAAIDVVDASGLTAGGLTATLDNTGGVHAANAIKVTGGAADDVITSDGILLADGSFVAAGAGTADRLVLTTAIGTANADKAAAARYTDFEQLQVNNGVQQDVSIFTGSAIDTVRINDGAGATSVTNLTASQAANVDILAANATGAITIGVKGASTSGQIDTVKADLTTTTSAGAAQAIDLTGLTLTGVENLELTGNGTAAASTGAVTLTTANATSLGSIKLANAGNGNAITIDAGQTATNLVVDATGSGNTTINASAYNTTTGANLTGGAGNDTITGTQRADVIVGGAGDDTIRGDNATNNAITATAGSATFVLAAGGYDHDDVISVTVNDGVNAAVTRTITVADANNGTAGVDTVGAAIAAAIAGIDTNATATYNAATNTVTVSQNTFNATWSVTTGVNNTNDKAESPASQTLTPTYNDIGTGTTATASLSVNVNGTTYPLDVTNTDAADVQTYAFTTPAQVTALQTAMNAASITIATNTGVITVTGQEDGSALNTVALATSNQTVSSVALAATAADAPATDQAAPTVSTTAPIAAGNDVIGTVVSDTLTGGAGKDTFQFINGTNATNLDTITDLDLGTASAAGRVDVLSFEDNFGGTIAKASLSEAQQTAVTAELSLADAYTNVLNVLATGEVATFTYGANSDVYVAFDGQSNDYLVKVTGVTGTLDAADISVFGTI